MMPQRLALANGARVMSRYHRMTYAERGGTTAAARIVTHLPDRVGTSGGRLIVGAHSEAAAFIVSFARAFWCDKSS